MKKMILIFASFYLTNFAIGQTNKKIEDAETIVWAGVDFSKAKMIGSIGFTDPVDINNRFLSDWNQLIIMESEKYDMKEAYKKDSVMRDLSVVNEQNKKNDPDKLVINEQYNFSDGDIESIVSNYSNLKEKQGVALVYVVEYFSKLDKESSIYAVFFDLATNEILSKQNYKSKPRGFGLRNYWAYTIYQTMKQSGKDYQ